LSRVLHNSILVVLRWIRRRLFLAVKMGGITVRFLRCSAGFRLPAL
jgi:hypothetical protein